MRSEPSGRFSTAIFSISPLPISRAGISSHYGMSFSSIA
jgi:hypothetical protein